MRRRLTVRGVTLPELVIGFGVFILLMGILAAALVQGTLIWNRSAGSGTSQSQLRKGYVALSLDLERTTFQQVRRGTGPISLDGYDGDALWFLSPVNPTVEEAARTPDGSPFWQRNVLYYTVVPKQHQKLYGMTCQGGQDAESYEVYCPHKLLIRKVIANSPPTTPDDDPEVLLDEVSDYLTRPDGFDITAMKSEPGVESVTIEATNLLGFRVRLHGSGQRPGEVEVDLSSAVVPADQRTVKVGSQPLEAFSKVFSFSSFPLWAPE